jgi:DNA mismatch repair ATPase MutS
MMRDGYNADMVKTLEQALAQVAVLSEEDQEKIGEQLLSHLQKLRRLREDIDKGIRSLDLGEGKTLDIEEFLEQQRSRYGRS